MAPFDPKAFWWCPSTNGACVRDDCIGCVCKDLQDQWDARVYPDRESLNIDPNHPLAPLVFEEWSKRSRSEYLGKKF